MTQSFNTTGIVATLLALWPLTFSEELSIVNSGEPCKPKMDAASPELLMVTSAPFSMVSLPQKPMNVLKIHVPRDITMFVIFVVFGEFKEEKELDTVTFPVL